MNEEDLIKNIERTNAMLDRNGLGSDFLSQLGIETIHIPGVKGYMTQFNSEAANHVGLADIGDEDADAIIERVVDFFKNQKKSFSWIVGPSSKPEDLRERLKRHGFALNENVSEYGLAMGTDNSISVKNDSFEIEEVTLEDLEREIYMMAEAFGMGMDTSMAQYMVNLGKMINSTDYYRGQIRAFLAKEKSTGKKVGFSIMEMDRKGGYAILDGAAVIQEFRGKGIYKKMIEKRREVAKGEGIEYLITHAVKKTSAPVCERVGFRRICDLDIYDFKI